MNLFNDQFFNNYYSAMLNNDGTSINNLLNDLGLVNDLNIFSDKVTPNTTQVTKSDEILLNEQQNFNEQLNDLSLKKTPEITKVEHPIIEQKEQSEIKTMDIKTTEPSIKDIEPQKEENKNIGEITNNVDTTTKFTDISNIVDFNSLNMDNIDFS